MPKETRRTNPLISKCLFKKRDFRRGKNVTFFVLTANYLMTIVDIVNHKRLPIAIEHALPNWPLVDFRKLSTAFQKFRGQKVSLKLSG